MTTETTVTKQAPETSTAPDLAPMTAGQQFGKVASIPENAVKAGSTQAAVRLEATKRKKTWGERVFDIGTYGGVALLGNEAASMFITGSVQEGKIAHGWHRKFSSWFENSGTSRIKSLLPRYIVDKEATPVGARLPFLLVATLGGMLMVPFVKSLEDHKGSIVRTLDRWRHGKRADTDPALVEAHKEMDDAPKQSWSSLGWGRVTTVISAAIADAAFGWKDAITTKIFTGPTASKYSSLDRIAESVAYKAVNAFSSDTVGKDLMHSAYTGEFGKLDKLAQKQKAAELGATSAGKWFGRIQNGTWLLTLSASLTLLFYASSKLFARKQDEKHDARDARSAAPRHHSDVALDEASTSVRQPEPRTPAQQPLPDTKVSSIAHEQMLASGPQFAHGA